MEQIQVFLDADVVIASLLSQKGASFQIINNPKIKKTISKTVRKEIDQVSERHNISFHKRKNLLKNIQIISLDLKKKELLQEYSHYTFDDKDCHVVAGAYKSKSRFLLTYNTKHYHSTKIKSDFGIIIIKPGDFLQYLRSLS